MFLESSFFPFPSEIVMPPAGYLAYKGKMSFFWAVFSGVAGSLAGALFNYVLALYFGRPFLLRFGRFMFIDDARLRKVERFFNDHGEITTFVGRLLPGVRQYISFPPGIARMDPIRFSIYTVLGAGVWVFILTYIGYVVGKNENLLKAHIHEATVVLAASSLLLVLVYLFFKKRKGKNSSHDSGDPLGYTR